MSKINIIKASGESVPFSNEKLRQSLQRAGADEDSITLVMDEMAGYIQSGMTTHQIFKHAFNTLKKTAKSVAARYKLKQAIMELGPSGYPFERFVADLLKSEGHQVQVGVIVSGHCVNHEIDVIALKEKESFMIECKFHNRPGIKCDVKIPLYIHSRFKDVSHPTANTYKFTKGWVFTNTKFSEDAIQYSTCMGLNLTGWDYPFSNSLREMIDRTGLHPITCLTTITSLEKSKLLELEIVHCKALTENNLLLAQIGIPAQRINKILIEARSLVSSNPFQDNKNSSKHIS